MEESFRKLERVLEEMRAALDRLESRRPMDPTAVEFKEAARMLSCSPRHVARMVARRELRVVMVGSLRRIAVDSIRALQVETEAPKRGGATKSPRQSSSRTRLDQLWKARSR